MDSKSTDAMTRFGIVTIVFATVAACSSPAASVPDAGPYTSAQIERGAYLVGPAGYCDFCHTPMFPDGTRDLTRRMAGRDCVIDVGMPNGMGGTLPPVRDDGYGCLSFTNSTNHASGIGLRTDAEIKAGIFDGKRFDGSNVSSAHPYWLYAWFSEADRTAVVAYLRSLPPVEMVGRREPPWDVVAKVETVQDTQIPSPKPDSPNLASAMRGRYFATTSACGWCHTATYPNSDPRAATDVIKRDQLFQGGRSIRALSQLGYQPTSIALVPPVATAMWNTAAITSSNITPDNDTGIGNYALEDFRRALKEGKDIDGKFICAGAHGDSTGPGAGLHDEDIVDLYNYFQAITAVPRPEANTCEAFR